MSRGNRPKPASTPENPIGIRLLLDADEFEDLEGGGLVIKELHGEPRFEPEEYLEAWGPGKLMPAQVQRIERVPKTFIYKIYLISAGPVRSDMSER